MLFKVDRDRAAFIDAMARRGVLVVAFPHDQIRAVTHYGVDRSDVETTIRAVRESLAETLAPAGRPAGAAA